MLSLKISHYSMRDKHINELKIVYIYGDKEAKHYRHAFLY